MVNRQLSWCPTEGAHSNTVPKVGRASADPRDQPHGGPAVVRALMTAKRIAISMLQCRSVRVVSGSTSRAKTAALEVAGLNGSDTARRVPSVWHNAMAIETARGRRALAPSSCASRSYGAPLDWSELSPAIRQATLRSTTCPAYGIWAPIRGPRIDHFKQSLAPPGKARRTRLSKKT